MLNSSAHVEEDRGKLTPKGNVTEVGILNYLIRSRVSLSKLYTIKDAPNATLFNCPFDSFRKMQTTAVLVGDKVKVHVKGAPEIVIDKCSQYFN